MGDIYSGSGWNRTRVGEYENGTIYSGTGWSKSAVGEYDNGTIYSGTGWNRSAIGEYDGGKIYSGTGWSKSAVGEYDGGTIYRGTGWNRDVVGEYTASPAGAAAFLLLSLGGATSGVGGVSGKFDFTNPWKLLMSLLGILVKLVTVVLKFIWKLLAPIIVYYYVPYWLQITWISLIPGILGLLLLQSGLIVMAVILLLLASIPSTLFAPLWIMLIVHRVKKCCDRRGYAQFCWKWFLNGPSFTLGFFKLLGQCIVKKAQWGSIVEYYKTWFYEVGLG